MGAHESALGALLACAEHYAANPVPVTAMSRPSRRGAAISQKLYNEWRAGLPVEDRGLAPSSTTIQRTFGTWNNAVEQAGLPGNCAPRPDYARVNENVAQAAVLEWMAWQDRNPHWAPLDYSTRQATWQRSRREYEQWRSMQAPAAPTFGQLVTVFGSIRQATQKAKAWASPSPDAVKALYTDTTPGGELVHARGTGLRTFHVTVTLEGVPDCSPASLQVSSDATWIDLHNAIQCAFGWNSSHLWRFANLGWEVTCDEYEAWTQRDLDMEPATQPVRDHLSVGTVLTYEYDFGDCWQHTVTVTAIHEGAVTVPCEPERGATDPTDILWGVVTFARNAPQDDSGGPSGWAHMKRVAYDPHDGEHGHVLEWLGWDCPARECPEHATEKTGSA